MDLDIEKNVDCPDCNGTGCQPGTSKSKCGDCNGQGQVRVGRKMGFSTFVTVKPCGKCRGEGQIIEKPCKKCKPKIQGSQRKVDQAKPKLSDLYSSMPVLQRVEASGKDTKSIAKAKRKAKNQKANRMINDQLAIANKAHKVGDVDTVVEALNKAMVLVPKRKDKNGNYTWQSTIDHIVKKARAFGVSVKALPDGGFYSK